MAAFRRAVELKCDAVELDVHKSMDGHLVVYHDYYLGRTSTGRGLLRDATLEQLRAEDAGGWKDPRFAGERIPTLREALIYLRDSGLRVVIELKSGSIHYPGVEADVLALVGELDMAERVQISSFDHKALKLIRDRNPSIHLGMLFDGNPLDPVAMARGIGVSSIHAPWQFTTPELVQAAHAAGFPVYVWTVNELPFAALMRACGVDGIMSDFPELLET